MRVNEGTTAFKSGVSFTGTLYSSNATTQWDSVVIDGAQLDIEGRNLSLQSSSLPGGKLNIKGSGIYNVTATFLDSALDGHKELPSMS